MLTTWWSTFTVSLNICMSRACSNMEISCNLLGAPSQCMPGKNESFLVVTDPGIHPWPSCHFLSFLSHTSTQPQHSLNNKNNTLPLDMHLIVLFWRHYNPSASLSTNHRLPHHPPPFAILEISFAVLEKRPPPPNLKIPLLWDPFAILEKRHPPLKILFFFFLRHSQFMKSRPNHSDKPCKEFRSLCLISVLALICSSFSVVEHSPPSLKTLCMINYVIPFKQTIVVSLGFFSFWLKHFLDWVRFSFFQFHPTFLFLHRLVT